jgi:hypothetical protein
MTPTIAVHDVPKSLGDGRTATSISRGASQSDGRGEYKDLYFREVMIDHDAGIELALNLRVQARIQVVPMEVTQ